MAKSSNGFFRKCIQRVESGARRASHLTLKSFRPINLFLFLLRILVKLINTYLICSSSAQRNYRKGRSVNLAIYEIIFTIEKAFGFKEGGFNNVSTEGIHRWLKVLLYSRTIKSSLKLSSVRERVTRVHRRG